MHDTVFIGLYDKDATKSLAGNACYNWKWALPNLDARKAPTMKLSVAAGYLDDSYPTPTGTQNCSAPRMLRFKLFSEDYKQNENTVPYITYPIMSIMVRDAFLGHWYCPQAPHQIDIDIPSNIKYLEVDFLNTDGNVLSMLKDVNNAGDFNMVLKLEYPKHNELRNEEVQSYAQSQIGNPSFKQF